MGNIPRHYHRTGERQTRGDRILPQARENLGHGPMQVDFYGFTAELIVLDLGHILGWIGFQLFEEHPILSNLSEDLAMRRTRHPQPHRARRAVAWQADDAHIVGKVLAAELGPY